MTKLSNEVNIDKTYLSYLKEHAIKLTSEEAILQLYENGYLEREHISTLIKSVAEGFTNNYRVFTIPQVTPTDMLHLLNPHPNNPWTLKSFKPHEYHNLDTISPYYLLTICTDNIKRIVIPLRYTGKPANPEAVREVQVEVEYLLKNRYNVSTLANILHQ